MSTDERGGGWPLAPLEGMGFGGNNPEEALLISTSFNFITQTGQQGRA